MNKFKLFFIGLSVLVLISGVSAEETQSGETWKLNRANFFFENDLFSTTDSQYSSGEKIGLLYNVTNPSNPLYNLLFLNYGDHDAYVSFALVNQIYTPADLTKSEPIEDDRPYAGWTYMECGIHKSTSDHLRSLYLHVGMVGPASKSEQIQKGIHEMTGSEPPRGWDNQLENELGINLKYVHKWRFVPQTVVGVESSFIPFVEADLGNVSTKAMAGAGMRIGWNIPKDFGVSTVDAGGEMGISVFDECEKMREKKWSFSFNFSGYGSAVARDIFLDGNTFKDSQSVDKEYFIGYLGFGFTARYESFVLDFIQTKSTPKFKEESGIHTVGTVVVSWLY